MAIVCSGFTNNASDTTYVEYEAQVNDMFGFIGWSGSITNVTCQEYLNGNYYTSYTLISNSQCIDSRASWALDRGTFYFNYGSITCDTKFVMTIETTVGTATFTQEYLINKSQVSLSPPGKPNITQNPDGTFTATWDPAYGTNGSGNVEYALWNRTNGEIIASVGTDTTYTGNIPGYGYLIEFCVVAGYSNIYKAGEVEPKTFFEYVSGPTQCTLDAIFSIGETTTLRWNAGTPGQNNPIKQYDVWCVEIDEDYNVVGGFQVTSTDVNTLETQVYPSDTPGIGRWFWVHAVGQNYSSLGSDREGRLSDNAFIRVTLCTPPTWCALDTMYSMGEGVMLRWNEGVAGVYNPINGYAVFRFEMINLNDELPPLEEWEFIKFVEETSLLVYPPEIPGHAYVYFVGVVAQNYQALSYDEVCNCENPLIRDFNNTIKYYTGSEWVDCIVYYYDGTKWVECLPYYYDGTKWVECSST